MANTVSPASQSAWFSQYEKEVNGKRNASNGNKKILVIIPVLLIGAFIAIMIKNGALADEQARGGLFALIGIAVFIVLLVLVLIGKGKKIDAAAVTRKDLDELLKTPEDAKEFDAQIAAEPLFKVANSKDNYIFATKDYIGNRFTYLGDLTYRFIRISDVTLLHAILYKKGSCDVEFRNEKGDVLLIWVAEDRAKVDELKAAMPSINVELIPAKE
ncbi:MAG: hypothetical protein J5570_08485 [Lachnospiraceae bacterium]|nr:hypothetical protein [Lachnospiraceae bacterium]